MGNFKRGDTVRIVSPAYPAGEVVKLSDPYRLGYANAEHVPGVTVELVKREVGDAVEDGK